MAKEYHHTLPTNGDRERGYSVLAIQGLSLLAVIVALVGLIVVSGAPAATAKGTGLLFVMLLGVGALILCLALLVESVTAPPVVWSTLKPVAPEEDEEIIDVFEIRVKRQDLQRVELDDGRVVASY